MTVSAILLSIPGISIFVMSLRCPGLRCPEATCLMWSMSENNYLVSPHGPIRQLLHRAAMRARAQLAVTYAARIHAGATYTHFSLAPRDHSEHVFDLVIACGNFLVGLGTERAVAHQKNTHLLSLALCHGSGQAQPVVGPLAAVGRV